MSLIDCFFVSDLHIGSKTTFICTWGLYGPLRRNSFIRPFLVRS